MNDLESLESLGLRHLHHVVQDLVKNPQGRLLLIQDLVKHPDGRRQMQAALGEPAPATQSESQTGLLSDAEMMRYLRTHFLPSLTRNKWRYWRERLQTPHANGWSPIETLEEFRTIYRPTRGRKKACG